MDKFFESEHFKNIAPVPRALEVLQQLHSRFELHIVTSRQHKLEDITKEWVNTHFPGIFTAFHFGNHYVTTGVSRSKPDMCRSINAVLLIDDSLRYAVQCTRSHIPVLLFGQYAWNQPACRTHHAGRRHFSSAVARTRHWRWSKQWEASCRG